MRGKLETNNWPTPIPTKLTCNVHAIKRHGVLLDPAHERNTAAGLDILAILVLTGCRTAEEASHPTPQLRRPIRSHGCKAAAAAPALRNRGLSVHIGQEVEDLNPDEWQIHGMHALRTQDHSLNNMPICRHCRVKLTNWHAFRVHILTSCPVLHSGTASVFLEPARQSSCALGTAQSWICLCPLPSALSLCPLPSPTVLCSALLPSLPSLPSASSAPSARGLCPALLLNKRLLPWDLGPTRLLPGSFAVEAVECLSGRQCLHKKEPEQRF